MPARPRKANKKRTSEAAPTSTWRRVEWILPCAVAFLASFCVMVLELVAGRLVARHLGASLYTWTSVIGVVLTGLAVGNYVGGRLADRYRPARVLSVLLIFASVCCLLSLPLNRHVGEWESLTSLSWASHIAVHVALIFLWPAAMLGTVAPVVAKMALDQGRQMGRTVGNVYAWGAVGSIFGTFLTGYWFIAAIGSTATVALVSGILAVVGVGFAIHSWLSRIWTGSLVVLALLLVSPGSWARAVIVDLGLREIRSEAIVYQTESAYSFIKVTAQPDEPNLRSLTLDYLVHSWVLVGDPTALHYDYERLYADVTHRLAGGRKPIRTLFIGGGGYTFPRYVERLWPGSTVDVAEIDPAVSAAAMASMGLEPNTTIRIHHLDARNHLDDLLRARQRDPKWVGYDFVYGDAFNHYAVPYHLTTLEFNEKLRQVMADDGVYMLNLIDMLASGRFLGAVVNTLGKTFDHVWVFRCRTSPSWVDCHMRDTFVVVASPSDVEVPPPMSLGPEASCPGTLLASEQLAELLERNGEMVLTDDYAPVENLLAPLYRGAIREARGQDSSIAGLGLALMRQYGLAAERYRQVLRLRPNSAEARSNLGWVLHQQGQHERALALFTQAIELDPTLATAHNNLGWALYKQGEHAEAVEALERAVRCKPDFALARNNLGLALVARGQIARAVEQYGEAIKLQPSFVAAHYNLASALARLGQTDGALATYHRVLALDPDHAMTHDDIGWLLHQRGKHARAEAELRAAIKNAPHLIRARNRLGVVLTAQGKLEQAVSTYADLLSHEPGNVEACNNLGIALARLGKSEEAARWFGETLKFRPDHGPARDNLLAIYMRTGQYARAVTLLRSAMKHVPDQPGILNNLAWILATCPKAELRDGAEAVRLARQADELSAGESPRVLDALAAAHAELGHFDQAVATAQRALALAKTLGHKELTDAIAGRLGQYQAGKPFRHGQ